MDVPGALLATVGLPEFANSELVGLLSLVTLAWLVAGVGLRWLFAA